MLDLKNLYGSQQCCGRDVPMHAVQTKMQFVSQEAAESYMVRCFLHVLSLSAVTAELDSSCDLACLHHGLA